MHGNRDGMQTSSMLEPTARKSSSIVTPVEQLEEPDFYGFEQLEEPNFLGFKSVRPQIDEPEEIEVVHITEKNLLPESSLIEGVLEEADFSEVDQLEEPDFVSFEGVRPQIEEPEEIEFVQIPEPILFYVKTLYKKAYFQCSCPPQKRATPRSFKHG